MSDFTFKTGDTWAPLVAVLQLSDGTRPDLTGATASFGMKTSGGSVIGGAAILDAVAQTATYNWQAADSAAAGNYRGEFVVTLATGRVLSGPDWGYIHVRIERSHGSRPVPPLPLIFDGSWTFDGSQQFSGIKA